MTPYRYAYPIRSLGSLDMNILKAMSTILAIKQMTNQDACMAKSNKILIAHGSDNDGSVI